MKMITTAQFELLKISLKRSGRLSFEVTSDSMSPLINVGDTISVVPLDDTRRARKFAILVFFQGGQLICHYLHFINRTAMSEQKFVTRSFRGREDLPISESEILGVVENFKIPFLQRLALSFRV